MKLFKRIKYEFGYDMETMLKTDIPECEKNRPLFWNNYNQKKFKDIVFDKIKNKKIDVYSFDKMDKLSSAEIDTLMINWIVEDIDPETGDFINLKENFGVEDLMSFIFYENWYINEKTLQIHKQVLGVAPVFSRSALNIEGEDGVERSTPFFIYFNKEK